MIRINLDMDMPEECHECPFQLKFKDDEVNPWYMRRCVIMHRNIEYPRPEWCPLEEQQEIVECKYCKHWHEEHDGHCAINDIFTNPDWHCADWRRR